MLAHMHSHTCKAPKTTSRILATSPPPPPRRIMRDIEFRTWYRNQPLGDSNEAESVSGACRPCWEVPLGAGGSARAAGPARPAVQRQQQVMHAPMCKTINTRHIHMQRTCCIHARMIPPQVLFTVRQDLDNPWTTVTRNTLHEAKLREWKAMGPQAQVLTKMADIIELVWCPGGGLDGGGAAHSRLLASARGVSVP